MKPKPQKVSGTSKTLSFSPDSCPGACSDHGYPTLLTLILNLKHYTLHPTPYTPHPTPYTLHPIPYTYTLHSTPYTLHTTPYTLHLTPYTLHHSLFTLPTHRWRKSESARTGGWSASVPLTKR